MSIRKILSLACLAGLCSLPFAASAQKVVVTPNGAKYHLETCRTIGASSGSKAVDVSEAKAAKLSACTVCKPPVKANANGVQCSGTNKDGARCKRKTTDKGSKCWQHA